MIRPRQRGQAAIDNSVSDQLAIISGSQPRLPSPRDADIAPLPRTTTSAAVADRSTISLSRHRMAGDGGSLGIDAVRPGSAGRCRERFACAATALVSHVRVAPDPTCADHTVFPPFVAQVGRIADLRKTSAPQGGGFCSWVQCRIARICAERNSMYAPPRGLRTA